MRRVVTCGIGKDELGHVVLTCVDDGNTECFSFEPEEAREIAITMWRNAELAEKIKDKTNG